jgi:hypothetical protein
MAKAFCATFTGFLPCAIINLIGKRSRVRLGSSGGMINEIVSGDANAIRIRGGQLNVAGAFRDDRKLRRAQGDALDVLGLGPRQCPFQLISSVSRSLPPGRPKAGDPAAQPHPTSLALKCGIDLRLDGNGIL